MSEGWLIRFGAVEFAVLVVCVFLIGFAVGFAV